MEAVASEVANKAAASCFDWATTQINEGLSYIQKYNDNIEKLRIKRRELNNLIFEIEEQVKAGERELKKPTPAVVAWLEDAKVFLTDDEWNDYMDEKKIREKVKCCFGLLNWNLKYRYLVSKRAKKKSKITDEKIKKMEDYGSRAITLPGEPLKLGSIPTAYSKSLASRESTLKEIMEALKDKEVGVIGIYGMGGVGKTTLIEEIARRAEADGFFDPVVIVEVSQTPNISKMQQQMAERIRLPLQNIKSVDERARNIHDRLKQLNHKKKDDQMLKNGERHVVVILDNIWNKLDLNRVGIPDDCKIVLTTRSEHVCREMGANKKFELRGLNDTEAMELFLERAGRLPDHDDGYKSITEELVKKCGGLPLAIITLADALKNRDLSDWKHVADKLGKAISARVGGPMEENVHPILEWSYNFISNEEKKKFFLLCCLFPLGSSIAIQDLMRYGAGLDLFQYMNSLGEAIEQANSWVAELKSSSLLLEAEDEQHVKIHDIVRAASMSIATKGKNIFHVGSLPRWQTKNTFRTYTAISMTSEDNHELLSRFEFPKLELLLLKGSQSSDKFSDNFFQGMKSLKVLVISGMKFQTLPSSITKLNNLRTLHLEHCELSDISAIASLVDLLFLSLHESKIDELPKELEKLGNLKLLDLTKCRKLRKIPAGLISMLTNLEGLYMMDSFLEWHPNNFESSSKKDELNDNKEMASLIELESLSYLDVLEMYVPKIHLLPNNLLFPHLSRFLIFIGHKRSRFSRFIRYKRAPYDDTSHNYYNHSKLLFLRRIDARRPLQQCINCLLKEAEHLSLEEISGLKNVVDSLDKDGFRNLKCLFVKECGEMESIVTTTELNEDSSAFPKLEELNVGKGMENLKVIYHGPPSHYSFHHLKKLKLFSLKSLWNFWDDHDMHSNQPFFNKKMKFPSLEELEIWYVGGIVELWNLSDVDEEVPAFPRLVSLTLHDLPELRSIWRSKDIVIHRSFRSLKSLKVSSCPKLEILCPFSVAAVLEQLETLEVKYNKNMKEIIAKEIGEMQNNDIEMTLFPKLRNMNFWSLPDLQCFFGGSIKLVFPSLESINFWHLNKMVTFVSSEYPVDSDALLNDKVALPAIKEIGIFYVNSPKKIWGSHFDAGSFNKLETLEVFCANEATKVFSLDAIKQMRNLKELNLYRFQLAEELIERIRFYNDDIENSALLLPQLRKLTIDSFPLLKRIPWRELALQNLRYLKIYQLKGLTYLFPTSLGRRLVNLEELYVTDCQMMEEIVGGESGDINTVEVNVVFPHLNIEQVLAQESTDDTSNNAASTTIVFLRVKIIKLSSLGSLCSFNSENYKDLEFPSLEEVTIRECPMMETFSYGSLSTPRLRKIRIDRRDEKEHLDLNMVIKKRIEEETSGKDTETKGTEGETSQRIEEETSEKDTKTKSTKEKISQRIEEEMSGKDKETKNIKGETSQRIQEETSEKDTKTESTEGETSQRIEEDMSGEDTETKSIEEETNQWIEEETSGEGIKTESTEGETSQRIEEKMSEKYAETKGTEGETSQRIEEETSGEGTKTESTEGETNQRIEEETMRKDRETKFIEGETSQGIEEETMCEDVETEFIEGMTSQGIEDETMWEDAEIEFIEGETNGEDTKSEN